MASGLFQFLGEGYDILALDIAAEHSGYVVFENRTQNLRLVPANLFHAFAGGVFDGIGKGATAIAER